MNLSNLKFDINDLVKITGLLSMVIALRYDIVNEIRNNKVIDTADKQIIEYRISRLEKCCNLVAVLPKSVAVPTYKVNGE